MNIVISLLGKRFTHLHSIALSESLPEAYRSNAYKTAIQEGDHVPLRDKSIVGCKPWGWFSAAQDLQSPSYVALGISYFNRDALSELDPRLGVALIESIEIAAKRCEFGVIAAILNTGFPYEMNGLPVMAYDAAEQLAFKMQAPLGNGFISSVEALSSSDCLTGSLREVMRRATLITNAIPSNRPMLHRGFLTALFALSRNEGPNDDSVRITESGVTPNEYVGSGAPVFRTLVASGLLKYISHADYVAILEHAAKVGAWKTLRCLLDCWKVFLATPNSMTPSATLVDAVVVSKSSAAIGHLLDMATNPTKILQDALSNPGVYYPALLPYAQKYQMLSRLAFVNKIASSLEITPDVERVFAMEILPRENFVVLNDEDQDSLPRANTGNLLSSVWEQIWAEVHTSLIQPDVASNSIDFREINRLAHDLTSLMKEYAQTYYNKATPMETYDPILPSSSRAFSISCFPDVYALMNAAPKNSALAAMLKDFIMDFPYESYSAYVSDTQKSTQWTYASFVVNLVRAVQLDRASVHRQWHTSTTTVGEGSENVGG